MAWLTIQDLAEHIPLEVYDANGMRINRKITGLDPQTGEVEFLLCDSKDLPFFTTDSMELLRARDVYPAPLLWKSCR